MPSPIEYTKMTKEEAAKLFNAQKVLLAYATEGMMRLVPIALESENMEEYLEAYSLYEEVFQYTQDVVEAKTLAEAQKLTDAMQLSMFAKVQQMMANVSSKH